MVAAVEVTSTFVENAMAESKLIKAQLEKMVGCDGLKPPPFTVDGSLVAMVTPMRPPQGEENDFQIDYERMVDLVNWHIEAGTKAIIVGGSTGEGSSLSMGEISQIAQRCIKAADNRIPIVVGTGTNCTLTTIDKTRMAFVYGASAALVVVPYYNKPTQEGMFRHFAEVADAVKAMPIILYNVPSRTGCDMKPETVKRLFDAYPNIVGIKEACGLTPRFSELRKLCGMDCKIYSGEDENCALDILDGGANGVISVTANICPYQMNRMCTAALAGNRTEALRLDNPLQPLHKALFVEPNPTGPKFVLQEMGKINEGLRLPLLRLSDPSIPQVREAYKAALTAEEEAGKTSVFKGA